MAFNKGQGVKIKTQGQGHRGRRRADIRHDAGAAVHAGQQAFVRAFPAGAALGGGKALGRGQPHAGGAIQHFGPHTGG